MFKVYHNTMGKRKGNDKPVTRTTSNLSI